jgi:hypothetical protein
MVVRSAPILGGDTIAPMTDREIAIKIFSLVREQQARITAMKTLLSRYDFDWKTSIEEDLREDFRESSLLHRSVSQATAGIQRTKDEQLLQLLRKEIFDPHLHLVSEDDARD